MFNQKNPIDNFSVALNEALLNRYGKIPSAAFFMNEFNIRSYGTKFITRETARKWIKGIGLPRAGAIQILVDWLKINPSDIFLMEATETTRHSKTSNGTEKVIAWHEHVKSDRLAKEAMQSVSPRIAILDLKGEIVLVNQAWRDMAFANSNDAGKFLCEGVNYLELCDRINSFDNVFSKAMATGIREAILDEKATYSLKYPCYTPKEKQWFTARVCSFSNSDGHYIIVYHETFSELEGNS
jgi:PAS domain-containing protein